MSQSIQIRMGGYGPPTTTFSRALKIIGDDLEAEFGDELEVKYVWNILDLGYRSEDTLWMAEHGVLTLAYQSTSYLTDRVPELGFTDLPFLFRDNEHARSAMDGALGDYLKKCIEDRANYRVLGFFENGFRHISNSLRVVRSPALLDSIELPSASPGSAREDASALGGAAAATPPPPPAPSPAPAPAQRPPSLLGAVHIRMSRRLSS
ncbi:MAG: hypothetical protein VCC36_07060, partial [Gammaproteobacteria bacterium]